jgi:ribosomal protein S18 acetylase RimI-like enzyme
MEVVNLRNEKTYLEQYVQLRNEFCELLLTEPVTIDGTMRWLGAVDVEIRGIVEDNRLLGCVILYIDKNGEVTFFARDKNKGIGTYLLEIVQNIAIDRKLGKVWSWVLKDNIIARRVFEKSGFINVEDAVREYRGTKRNGVVFVKKITGEVNNVERKN